MTALDPNVRLALTDALRPPPGYVLGAGLGTAFSVEFDAFTAVALAFVGADLEEGRSDTPAALTAVARLRGRLRLLVNAGGIHPPRKPNRLVALYDRILRPVRLGDSAFHPKVWVLGFEPLDRPESRRAPRRYRVLCSSRNVTDSRSWELGARFEGLAGSPNAFGADVAAFCRRLGRGQDLPDPLRRLIAELPRVEFDRGPESADGLRLYFQWPGADLLGPQLPGRASRALLISPFIRADFLGPLLDRVKDLTLVSRQDELDALPTSMHERMSGVATYVVNGAGEDDLPALDLHAKLLVWEDGAVRETLLGSANATGAAWGLGGRVNCEAMVSLRPGLSMDAAIRSFVAPPGGPLRGWIEEYRREERKEEPEDLARRHLERLQRELSQLQATGRHDLRHGSLTLTAKGRRPGCITPLPDGVEVMIAPLLLSSGPDSWRPLTSLFEDGATFEQVTLQDLCAFAIVRLRDTQHDQEVTFGLQFELPLTAEQSQARDDAVQGRLLAAYDARALLLDILSGIPAGANSRASDAGGGAGSWSTDAFFRHATIERVMEACTADRSRIDEVDALLSACRDREGMEGFVAFWGHFKAVVAEERRNE